MPTVQSRSYRAEIATKGEPEAANLIERLEAELGDEVSISWSERADNSWIVDLYWEDLRPDIEHAISAIMGTSDEAASVEIGPLPETDWVAESLTALAPVRAGRFLVHGSHDRAAVSTNDIAIEIEANRAFGTGHHGTTTGCLLALDDLRRRRHFRSALDIGTGSGVLAIAVARAWRIPVVGTEIDPVAAGIAAENARLNRVGQHVAAVVADGLHHRRVSHRRFDLVVANILASPLAALATPIARHLLPGGTLVLSGLLPHQQRWIVGAYRSRGIMFRRAMVIDGWLTLILERGAVMASPHDGE